ncbi:Bax inhibitor-1/YccA family protein [Gorillibacterium sp. CAU 1737]|uniref:Bax inhibitor-1/YccA family protein n=1 Tax=Gorillibacterium sp. CAU 1737 TaxID=3140362 RepID=UPI003261CEDB
MDFEQQQSIGYEREYNSSFHKLLKMFTLSILVSFLGTLVGMFIPTILFIPLVVVEFVMIISAFFVRRRKKAIGYPFVFSFALISGITLYPTVAHYSAQGGFSLVNTAFLITALIFGGLTAYAYYSKRDFSFLGGFLVMGVITLIGFSVIGLFTGGFGGTLGLGIAIGGTLIFSGYILYDISHYKHGLEEEMIPFAVLNLYLDFINLFLYVLRLLGFSRD